MKKSDIREVTAIVLAGGKSSRMGGVDKSMLEIKGMPMIQYIVKQLEEVFGEVIIGSNDAGKYKFLGHRVVPDLKPGMGPLMGIYSCIRESSGELNFITACDIPDIRTDIIMEMLEVSEGVDIIMPVSGTSDYEPMYAIYRKSVIGPAELLLRENKLKIAGLFNYVNTRFFPFDGQGWYYNLNYSDDFLAFSREAE